MYVPVVTLSKENDIKLLEKLKSGFKRTIKWNKYRSQMSVQSNNNNLNYLIDPTFRRRQHKKDYRDYFSHYYVPKIQIKDFSVLIDGKSFFDLPIKNEESSWKDYWHG